MWLACLAAGAARAERLPVRVYTTADGLGSSAVNWVLRDSRGFMWFGTRDGLSRFDGQRFTTYRFGQGKSPSVSQIIERRRGDYLVVLQSGDLYRFDAQTPVVTDGDAPADDTLTLRADLLTDSTPGGLFEDHAGRLWGMSNDGLSLAAESEGRLVFQPVELRLPGHEEPAGNVTRMIEARDGSLWMSTNLGLVRRTEDGRMMLYSASQLFPIANFLTSLCEDGEGRIWVGARRGVYVLRPLPLSDPSAFQPRTLADARRDVLPVALPTEAGDLVEFTSAEAFVNDLIFAIYQTQDGRVWLSCKNGLTVFDGHEFRRFDAANGLGAALDTMTEDADGNLWVGSLNGAIKLVTRGLSTYGKDDGLGDRIIRSIYQTAAGDFYVVNGDWQVSRLDGRRFSTARPQLGDTGPPVWTSNLAFPDSAGAWWFLTEQKLFRYDHAQQLESLSRRPSATYATGPDFHDGAFYLMFEDSRGRLWISSRSAASSQMGLSLWQRETNTFHHFGAAEEFPAGRAPSAFSEDAAGNVWLGFYRGDVARYAEGKFTLMTSADGLPEGFVTAIHSDRAGRLWIASNGGGLSRVDDPTAEHPAFVNYTTASGLSSNNVRAITEDEEGRIYVGTVRGVDRLSPDTGRVRHYTMADGLADDFITVAFRDRDGALWFGTLNGLSRLVPETDLPAHAPPIMIGAVLVAGVKQPLSELGQAEVGRLNLNYTQANLQIDFFSLSFAPAERIRYQHKLEGADSEWSAPAAERTVTYANLAPGAYRFLVRAVNADGAASLEPAIVSFRISPPVWSHWWFILSAALLFGAGVYAFARAGFRRKLELERVRTRIATDLHDDIGASLTRIAMLSEVTQRENGGAHPSSARRLTQIADDARTLVDSMSDIVWAIDPRRDDFLSVVERVRSFAADTLGTTGVRWKLTVAPQLEGQRLTPEQRRALYLIFKEAISNVARHADCRHVSCRITLENNALAAVVEDDGRGLETARAGKGRGGRGLSNMRVRAAEMGGKLEIEPRSGGGTRLTLKLPLRADSMNMFSLPRRGWFKMSR
ncbi:MAG TPA: two-component regulator propeller domain-containing protein [Pyrinomonadaceae bacterium]|nr:two-component regulator propeller domain-containing protein [Pyrinomonadaceae bacterium]